jgi:hypothetical protein
VEAPARYDDGARAALLIIAEAIDGLAASAALVKALAQKG